MEFVSLLSDEDLLRVFQSMTVGAKLKVIAEKWSESFFIVGDELYNYQSRTASYTKI